jgi:hypothetical protein
MIYLWEILVPMYSNDGEKFPIEHHKKWDSFVKTLSNGLTIFKTSKGIWVAPDGKEYNDRMIPVRIACTREIINQIIDFTISHYKQEAVTAYRISEEVIIKHK